ncbi:MAG: hypothetical protein ACXV95_07180 [Acidimicrobiales bacterium]
MLIAVEVGAGLSGAVWLATWLPSNPLGPAGSFLLMPVFVLVFVGFGAVVYEQGSFSPRGHRRRRLVLPTGWRRVLLVALWLLVLVSFVSAPGGRVEHQGNRYFQYEGSSRHEITRAEFDDQEARSARPFAGAVLGLSCFVLVMLSVDRAEHDRQRTMRLTRVADSWRPRSDRSRRAPGWCFVQGEPPGGPDQVIDRLRHAVPVLVSARSTTSRRVTADWTQAGVALDRTLKDLWLIGSVEQTLHGTSLVQLEIRSAGFGWMVPTRPRIVALLVGTPIALAALAVAAATVSFAFAVAFLLLVSAAVNLGLAWWSTSVAVRRGGRTVATAIGLPPP